MKTEILKSLISKDDLYKMYICENLSAKDIANKYDDINYRNIYTLLNLYCIKKDKQDIYNSPNRIKKIVEHNTGRIVSDETRSKMSKNNWMKNHSEEEEKKRVEKWRKTYFNNYEINVESNRKAQLERFSDSSKLSRFVELQRITKSKNNTLNPVWLKSLTHEQRTEMTYKAIETKKLNGTLIIPNSNSKPNELFAEELTKNGILFEREFFIDSYKYVYDFKVGNTFIEINPSYTHNSTYPSFNNDVPLDKNYHLNKLKSANDLGYSCIHVFDWDDYEKIINLLLTRDTIYARKCYIKNVSQNEEKEFLNSHHLQGYVKSTVSFGLYYNNELVSIMTFGRPRYNKNFEWELLRYCSIKNVIGGEEKLFKHFLNEYIPKSIVSYCDRSKFSGKIYVKLNFKLGNNPKPSKHWYNQKTKMHITDNLLRQRGFDQLFGTNFGKGTSNNDLMLNNGFVEVYDCGQSRYEWFN